jgi:HSP20 family protein
MPETKSNRSDQSGREIARRDREDRDLQRWTPGFGKFDDPFEFMTRMTEEMDRTFDRLWSDFRVPRRRSWLPRGLFGGRSQHAGWAPRIEAFQEGDKFIVRAEIPGVKKDDVEVELGNDALTIRGERREERKEEREGYFQSEREYGQFYRVIPLPEGVIGESAQASFRDGMLEVSMQAAPAETSRGRRLEIKEATEGEQRK